MPMRRPCWNEFSVGRACLLEFILLALLVVLVWLVLHYAVFLID